MLRDNHITGLLGEAFGEGWVTFSSADIYVDPKKKVVLGVLRGADHDGQRRGTPFSTVDGVSVKFKVTL